MSNVEPSSRTSNRNGGRNRDRRQKPSSGGHHQGPSAPLNQDTNQQQHHNHAPLSPRSPRGNRSYHRGQGSASIQQGTNRAGNDNSWQGRLNAVARHVHSRSLSGGSSYRPDEDHSDEPDPSAPRGHHSFAAPASLSGGNFNASHRYPTENTSRYRQELDTNGSREKYIPEPIAYSAEYMRRLRSLAQPAEVLSRRGFVMDQLTPKELERKKRCVGCGKLMPKIRPPRPPRERSLAGQSTELEQEFEKLSTENTLDYEMLSGNDDITEAEPEAAGDVLDASEDSGKPPQDDRIGCRYHTGRIVYQAWTCCKLPSRAPGCVGAPTHIAKSYPPSHIENLWYYHPTPTPLPPNGLDIRPAVALDCEMGSNIHGDSELIRVSVIDYFTAEVLLDSLVFPDEPVGNYHTRYSGVSQRDMLEAVRNGNVIHGRDKAREEVLKFVGESTVVIGHSVYNDLGSLRWIHPWVVDTYIYEVLKDEEERRKEEIEKEKEMRKKIIEKMEKVNRAAASGGVRLGDDENVDGDYREENPAAGEKNTKKQVRSLKDLTLLKLGRVIQNKGKDGHDSVEDAVATRDLTHYIVVNE